MLVPVQYLIMRNNLPNHSMLLLKNKKNRIAEYSLFLHTG